MKRIHWVRFAGVKLPKNARLCTRPGALGNPFPLEKGATPEQRTQCLADFRRWAQDAMNGPFCDDGVTSDRQRAFKAAVLALKADGVEQLACNCRLDEDCHVDIIIELAKSS